MKPYLWRICDNTVILRSAYGRLSVIRRLHSLLCSHLLDFSSVRVCMDSWVGAGLISAKGSDDVYCVFVCTKNTPTLGPHVICGENLEGVNKQLNQQIIKHTLEIWNNIITAQSNCHLQCKCKQIKHKFGWFHMKMTQFLIIYEHFPVTKGNHFNDHNFSPLFSTDGFGQTKCHNWSRAALQL